MQIPGAISPVMDFLGAVLDKFVAWNVDHEWVGSKSLLLVSPGEGLDAKALELADTVGLDAGTMKVCLFRLLSWACFAAIGFVVWFALTQC